MVILLNMFLYTLSVIMFICGMVSLVFFAFPFFLIFAFLFSLCYFAIQHDGNIRAKHHVIHFVDDSDGGEGEPTPDYQNPFNRENFKFN